LTAKICSRRTLIAGALAAPLIISSANGANGLRACPAGVYLGDDAGAGVARYLGIRYGGPPRRFMAPSAPPDAAEPVAARGFAASCPQKGDRYQPQSEDCLFLNIWAPIAPSKKRPVMVYFHGGAYSSGSVADPLNDGAALAARGDLVVVTVNHRLNAFGYLYLARLDARFPDSGNVGQLDLILALKWIQRNIASFGGDPENITVFGQSGGGAKIASLTAMPGARGLFHKAITMSGQQVTVSGPLNATKRAQAFLETLGAGDPASMPVERLVAALSAVDPVLGGDVYFGPVLDMRAIERHPFWPDAHPQSLKIPMLLGNTVAETRAFYPPDHAKMRGLDWSNLGQRMAGEMRIDIEPDWVLAQFRARYPEESPEALFHRIVTAARSWRGQVIEAEERARAGYPAFVYQLDFENAKHTDDIGLAFGTIPRSSDQERAMSARVMDAFIRFAREGEPGWPAYRLKSRKTMVFDVQSRVIENPRQWERELFARVPYIQPGT
jgi:para-nitrobenzyl esterase